MFFLDFNRSSLQKKKKKANNTKGTINFLEAAANSSKKIKIRNNVHENSEQKIDSIHFNWNREYPCPILKSPP
jgi:hypothetical protein